MVILYHFGEYEEHSVDVIGTYSENNRVFAQKIVDDFNKIETYSARRTRILEQFLEDWIDPVSAPVLEQPTKPIFDHARAKDIAYLKEHQSQIKPLRDAKKLINKQKKQFERESMGRYQAAEKKYLASTAYESALAGTRDRHYYYSLESVPHNAGID